MVTFWALYTNPKIFRSHSIPASWSPPFQSSLVGLRYDRCTDERDALGRLWVRLRIMTDSSSLELMALASHQETRTFCLRRCRSAS